MNESLGSQASRTAWARDFTIVGAASSLLAPLLITGFLLGPLTLVLVTLAGAGSGAVLGLVLHDLLTSDFGELHWLMLVVALGAVGGLWGGVVGVVGGIVFAVDAHVGGDMAIALFMLFAALAGAPQLAWFGTAYNAARRRRMRVWPLVTLACGMPFIGWVGLVVVGIVPLGTRT